MIKSEVVQKLRELKEEVPEGTARDVALGSAIDTLEQEDTRLVGQWKSDVLFYLTCSECRASLWARRDAVFLDHYGNYNYCPNCGAKMIR